MIRVLLFLLVPSGLLAQDSLIVSLESRLDAVPDSLKREVRQELSRQYFFYSFKYPDSTEFRQAMLAKGFSFARENHDTLLMAAHHLELTHFLRMIPP